jgi:hypothetical protein
MGPPDVVERRPRQGIGAQITNQIQIRQKIMAVVMIRRTADRA